ncbi:MAG: prolipoprotein diacylglyceryl transferase [Thermotaleaceae bacterium]
MENVQQLNRVAFEIGPITVYWYGIIIATGILLGWILASKESKKLGLSQDILSDLLIWAIPISIISARIYYVVFKWDYYKQSPEEIIAIWNGGIAIHGAIIGGALTAIIFSKKKGISFWKLADIIAPSLILGQSIGRWGNFMNQEAYGSEVSRSFLEALYLPEYIINQMYIEGSYYHPTFLYESMWNLMGFIILLIIRRRSFLRRGELFLSYLIWYSIGRFFDTLRIAQLISIILLGTAIFLIWLNRNKGLANYRSVGKR